MIRTVARREYWNGTRFVDGYATVDAVLASVSRAESAWSYEVPVNPGHTYWVSARAVDAAGNRQVVLETSFVGGGTDQTEPLVSIESPAEDSVGPVAVSGTAVDQDLAAVRVVVRDEASGLYWNGEDFQESFIRIPAEIALIGGQQWTWTLTIDVPAGSFYVAPWAFDVAGNTNAAPPPSESIDVG